MAAKARAISTFEDILAAFFSAGERCFRPVRYLQRGSGDYISVTEIAVSCRVEICGLEKKMSVTITRPIADGKAMSGGEFDCNKIHLSDGSVNEPQGKRFVIPWPP